MRVVLHRLTQQAVRTRLVKPPEDCGVFQAVLASACTGDPSHPDHWPRYAALAEHVIQLDRLSPHGSLDPVKIVGLLNQVALFPPDSVQFGIRMPFVCSEGRSKSRTSSGAIRTRTPLTSMNNLALTLRAPWRSGRSLQKRRNFRSRVLEGCRQALERVASQHVREHG